MRIYTEREVEVASLVSDGLTNAQTADVLCVTVDTVRFHLKEIYSKIGTSSRAAMAARFARGEITSAPRTPRAP